jgi:hexosaminidase
MQNIPVLLPTPRELELIGGLFTFQDNNLILLDNDQPQSLIFSALRLRDAVNDNHFAKTEIYASGAFQMESIGITMRLDPQLNIKPHGYCLKITPARISIESRDEPGLFYACCTLVQLFQYYAFSNDKNIDIPFGSLPCLEVQDWPDFPIRGVLLDVSRDKVPTMETIFNLVDLLASWKINQLQLYTEHTFAYQMHPEVWAEATPFTGEEILLLDAFCRERFIELVPNQSSFGHLEPWLKLPRYRPLAEAPNGFDTPWGHHVGPYGLCPLDPGSISFLASLYDELLPHFSSRQFNIGCDETFDLGLGRSKAECERLGTGRVYLDFLLKIYHEVRKRGFRIQFWGDIIMTYPGLVKELPKDIITLEWGYEANHPFDEHGEKYTQAGLDFYVCPGTSAWNSIAGRTDNCLQNLSNAAKNGIKHGAEGYLITDWGDNGHWQALPVSYLGLAAGAAYSWSYQTNRDMNVREAINRYAFLDPTGTMGEIAYDLGNVYHEVGIEPENESALFNIMQRSIHELKDYLEPKSAIQMLDHTLEVIEQVTENQSKITSLRPDKELLQREFKQTIDLLRHACMRGVFGFGSPEYSAKFLMDDLEKIIAEYQLIWLARNRPGGLKNSLAYFTPVKNDYH